MSGVDLFCGMKRPVLLMDGGLGTTLEDTCKIQIAATPLWSAEALSKEPEAIIAAHLAFLRAGAVVLQTSTYQCSFNTFQRAGYNKDEAWQLMRKAVLLAHEARTIFLQEWRLNNVQQEEHEAEESGSDAPSIRICLSLGPFGATLTPTQEFGGFYPPPYGPRGYSADGPNTNWIDNDMAEDEAIEALVAFHLERLSLFAEDSDIWSYIDLIAFETVPLAREAISIRQTMARLQEKNVDLGKQWWISFVFPEGRCPEMLDAAGTRLTGSDLARASLALNPLGRSRGRDLPVPHGIGINCTSVEHLLRVVNEMEEGCRDIGSDSKQFIVLYPNGGGRFDESDGTWKGNEDRAKSEWGIQLAKVVDRILEPPDVSWPGVVVGGCCRCNAEEIFGLSKLLK